MTETPERRSRTMRAIKSRDTKPEMIVRRLLHGMGYRYRLHRRDLSGNPDIVFGRRRKAIFVHGCFWHGHDCPRGARVPAANQSYWIDKIARNRVRDQDAAAQLVRTGWSTLAVWECELRDPDRLARHLKAFLG